MHPFVFRMFIVFTITFILNILREVIIRRERIHYIEYPTKIQRGGYITFIFVNLLMVLLVITGYFSGDTEFLIVSTVLMVVFLVITYFTRRKFRRYYEETDTHFTLKGQYEYVTVQFENIVDWIPLKNKIGIKDITQYSDRYITVQYKFSDPEILLKKLSEMIDAGEFRKADSDEMDDPNRNQEFIKHLEKNGFKYLIK